MIDNFDDERECVCVSESEQLPPTLVWLDGLNRGQLGGQREIETLQTTIHDKSLKSKTEEALCFRGATTSS